MKKMLELQADLIEKTLWDFGLNAQIFAGQVLPRLVVYQVQLGRGQRLRDLTCLHTEIAIALQVPGVLINRRDGAVRIEVPRAKGAKVVLGQIAEHLNQTPPPHTALLGISNQGCPLMLYMLSPDVAHVLVAGMTGSGKTELLCSMLSSLAMWSKKRQAQFYLVDPKQRKLASMAGLNAVLESCGAEAAMGLLERLLIEMERRDIEGYCDPRLYLFIDEVADLVLVGGKTIEAALTRLVQRGREAGLHVIASTQRPSAAVIQGLMKANFPVRISGSVNSAMDASIALGLPNSGAERLMGKGDMVLAHHGQILRFQACIVADVARGDNSKVAQLIEPVAQVVSRLQGRMSLRSVGRPAIPPSAEMVEFAATRIREKGRCSQRELRRWHEEEFGTDVNPPRAAAAIEEAKGQLGF